MESEQGIRRVVLDPSEMNWQTPEEALRRLDAFAQLADTDRLGRGRPLPAKHHLQILGELLDHLLPDGAEEFQEEPFHTLDLRQREYLAHLVHTAREALERRQREAPAIQLGVPPGMRATWANILGRGWVPWQPEWFGVLRK